MVGHHPAHLRPLHGNHRDAYYSSTSGKNRTRSIRFGICWVTMTLTRITIGSVAITKRTSFTVFRPRVSLTTPGGTYLRKTRDSNSQRIATRLFSRQSPNHSGIFQEGRKSDVRSWSLIHQSVDNHRWRIDVRQVYGKHESRTRNVLQRNSFPGNSLTIRLLS